MSLDKDAVVQLLMREHERLRAYCWVIVRDDHLIEDILQEVGLIAIRKCGEIDDESYFLAWARVTCRNLAREMLRRRGRGPIFLDEGVLELLDEQWSEMDQIPPSALKTAPRYCVGTLSDYGRQLLQLRYREGLRSAQIAERLERKPSTIYMALSRVHRRLLDCTTMRLAEESAYNA